MVDGNRAIWKIWWARLRRFDCIPHEWFGKEGTLEYESHLTTGPRGGDRVDAICRVCVWEDRADLNYGGNHEQQNRRNGVFIGTTQVTFYDLSRDGIHTVEWRGNNGEIYFINEEDFSLEINNSSESKGPKMSSAQVIKYDRDPEVVKYALAKAKGKCGDCKKRAPFKKASTNEPYLEVHHKIPLAQGGSDTRDNVVALCPNCHRKRHYG